jgi:hypothetical protein
MNPKANRSLEKFCWDLPDIGTARMFCRNSMGWTDEFDKLVVPVMERLRERSVQVHRSSLGKYVFFCKMLANLITVTIK